jgi:hypothetical protein
MRAIAARIGCTEGQAYTVIIGAVLATLLAVGGLAPALRATPVRTASAAAPPPQIPGYSAPIPPSPTVAPLPPALQPPSLGTSVDIGFGSPPGPGPVASGFGSSPGDSGGTGGSFGSVAAGSATVADASYARAVGGAPGTVGVPADGVPVGARAGNEDARAYLHLEGKGTTLTLTVHPDTSSTFLVDQAAISVCPVVQPGWKLEPGSALADAPKVDTERCVDGTVDSKGSWTFPLALLGDVTASGVALVPDLQAGQTFQVTFQVPPRS